MLIYSVLINEFDFVVEAENEEEAVKEALYLYKDAENLYVSVKKIEEANEIHN